MAAERVGFARLAVLAAQETIVAAREGDRRGPEPIVKILDWGLARIKPGPDETVDARSYNLESEKGKLIGTAGPFLIA